MSRCDIQINFDKSDRIFTVGEGVNGTVNIIVNKSTVCRGVHITWQWRTHGRGNVAKSSVNENEIVEYVSGDELEEGKEYSFSFSFPAPNGPLTYRGHYLNVDWYLSARVDARGPFDPKKEEEFLLLPAVGKEVTLGPSYSPDGKSKHKSASGCGGIFSIVFLIFSLLWIIVTFVADATFFLILLGWAFFGVSSFLTYRSLRNFLARNKLGEVKVVLDDYKLVPGETLNCQVTFTPKATIDLKHIACNLRGKEQVISGSGTNQTTHTYKLYDQEQTLLENSHFEAGEEVNAKLEVDIPEDAAYTFMAADNKLFWETVVIVDAKGWPNWIRSYPITVQPWKNESRNS